MKKSTLLLLLLLTVCLCTTSFAADHEKDIKAGFIYVGPVGDAGWTYSHDQGRQEMEALPFVKPSTFIESVPEGGRIGTRN